MQPTPRPIPKSTPRSGSPKRTTGGVCRRPHYPKYPSIPFVFLNPSAPSLLLRGRVTESFDLFSGEAVQPSDYVQDLLLYRVPCLSGAGAGRIAPPLADGLRASFPVTPSHQYTIAELLQGEVGIAIVPPEMEQSGVLAGPDGALLLTDDGIALLLPAGALERTVPVQLQSLANTAVAPLVPEGFVLLGAVRIDLSRQSLQTGALLSLPLPAAFDPLRPVVLAQVFTAGGGERLRGVAFLKPVGSLLTSVTSVGGVALPGIRSGGTYCLLQSESLLGLVRGTVRTATSQPFSGALVTANSGSLADLSAASGSYLLFAPLGQVHVTALDLTRFDRGEASGTLAYAESALSLDSVIRPTVPSVVALAPDNGASGVDPAARISITFSEPLERSSITSASIVLSSSDNTPVAGVFSFSPDATTVSFYPETRLVSEGRYTIAIATSVRDLQGYGLAAPLTASFTVRDTTPPPMPPAGSISATFPDEEGMISVTATQGSAEYDATVLIINDTSGEIVSIAPFSNGSFNARIHGQLGDEIQVVLMDNAGNRTLISYLTFTAADGRTLVTAKGGKVAGEGGLSLDIPAGALVGPVIIKITTVQEANLPSPLQAPGRFLGAVKIDTGGIPFQKAVEISIPLPVGFNQNSAVFVTKPGQVFNADGTVESVYEIVDSTKIVGNRLSSACEPFPGVWGGTVVFTDFPNLTPTIVSGYTYQDRNEQASYQAPLGGEPETPVMDAVGNPTYKYDRPISGAVIRSPDAWNYVSYSNSQGFYGTFASMAVLPAEFSGVDGNCKRYRVTAIHPQTMFQSNFDGYVCASPYNVRDLNFRLADKATTIPDTIAPVVSLGLKVAAEQSGTIVAGTVPIGTELEVPISVIDQDLSAVYLMETFQTPEMPTALETPLALAPPTKIPSTPMQDGKPALFRSDYLPRFTPNTAGTYKFVVEAVDGTGLRTTRTVQVRAVNQGEQPASIDGAPQVDDILPGDKAKEIMVTTPVIVTFSEPLDSTTVTTANLRLVDLASGLDVPVYLYTSIEGGQMRVTLQPRRNLQYDHAYRVMVSNGLRDAFPNPGHGNVTLPLDPAVSADFTTKVPRAFDLEAAESFEQGFGIDLYNNGERTYAYVTARANGWRVIDITDPTAPRLVYTRPPLAGISFRGVGVDDVNGVLGITEDIRFADGAQFGYVRFYNLAADPVAPPRFAQEKLAEAFSGIPGRLALNANYAYIATVGVGLQVVDIAAAEQRIGKLSDGSTIVGFYDSIGQRFGHPNDVQVYGPGKLLVTTNSGYLLLFSIAMPQVPTLSSSYPQGGLQASRAAAVSEYTYTAADGTPQTIDLAVIVGRDQLKTVDISNPYTPTYLGTAANPDGSPASVMASDITISKNAGLAFVSSFSAIQVFDIKDPHNPLLLQTITQLPDENGDLLPIGMTNGLVEKDGWVYLANQKDGMRVIEINAATITADMAPLADTEVSADLAEIPILLFLKDIPEELKGQKITIQWELIGSGGYLTYKTSTSSDGLFETTLKTTRKAGDTYKVTPYWVKEDGTLRGVGVSSGLIRVVAGEAASIEMTPSRNSYPADRVGTVDLELTAKDAFGNLVADGTDVVWELTGDGVLVSGDKVTLAGKAKVVAQAGGEVGTQTISAAIDGEVQSTQLDLTPIDITVLSGKSEITVGGETTTIEVFVSGDVAANARVEFFSTLGEIQSSAPVVDGWATATFKSRGLAGSARIVANVGESHGYTDVEIVDHSLYQVNFASRYVVGDQVEPGSIDIDTGNGVTPFAYPTSTTATIKGEPGAKLSLRLKNNIEPIAWYMLDTPPPGGVVSDIYHDYDAIAHGTVDVDNTQFATGASYRFNGENSIEIPGQNSIPLEQVAYSVAVRPAEATGESITLIQKAGSFRLDLVKEGSGYRPQLTVTTDTGTQTLRSGDFVTPSSWSNLELAIDKKSLTIRVNDKETSELFIGQVQPGTGSIIVADKFVGNLDNLKVYDLSRSGLLALQTPDGTNEITLDENGEATVVVQSLGSLRRNCPNYGLVEILAWLHTTDSETGSRGTDVLVASV